MKLLEYTLSPGVRAFSTMRQGGFSQGNYGEFNANAYCGDNREAVQKNRQLMADALGITTDNLIFTHQIHSTFVRVVNETFMRLTPAQRTNQLEGVDAVVTNLPGVCLCISTADCIPIIIYDTRHRAAACIHAGWRGSMQRIVESAFDRMADYYGTKAGDCQAVIGPGISVKNYEVGDEVYAAFAQAQFDMEQIAVRQTGGFKVKDGKLTVPVEKWHIDLPRCNRLQLLGCGLAEENIHDCGICTYDHVDDFFSARRLGVQSGRIITGVMIENRTNTHKNLKPE